jgi:hypothetical protein
MLDNIDFGDMLLMESAYDDTPWTRDELQTLSWETGRYWGSDDMDEHSEAFPGYRRICPRRARHSAEGPAEANPWD